MSLWDLAALQVIVEEAGGRFTDLGGVRTADGGDAIATNGALHDARARRSSGASKRHTSHMERLFGDDEAAASDRTAPAGADAPLATRMRPRTLDEFVGQERLLAPARRCAQRSRRAAATR